MDLYLLFALGLGLASALALYIPFRRLDPFRIGLLYVIASAALGVLAYHLTLLWVFGVYGPSSDALWALGYAMFFLWNLGIALVVLLIGGAIRRRSSGQ